MILDIKVRHQEAEMKVGHFKKSNSMSDQQTVICVFTCYTQQSYEGYLITSD